jgi:hypothetical protein
MEGKTMAFKTLKQENFTYTSPQEMYQDNKNKKIMGLLDYQASMLEKYIENQDKNILAMELPTGSGKTLVGLLIGEFRRRKNKEKIVYLCPTNQLVNQVVSHANQKYGIKAIAFCGKQKNYDPKEKTSFLLADAIGVTTYSSFFALNSFFSDVDIIIMDDVHSSEEYIVSNWTLEFKRGTTDFFQIVELFKDIISENDYHYLKSDELNNYALSWCNIVPMPLITPKLTSLLNIIRKNLDDSSNYYSFERIKENIQECNIFLSCTAIHIRPWIAPTLTFPPFKSAKQKILMSATLGQCGELERITGMKNINRLPIVNDWDKKGLGRKYFIFPDLSLKDDSHGDILLKLHKKTGRSVILVPDNKHCKIMEDFFSKYSSTTSIYNARGIEVSKEDFINEKDAVVIMANRFDGVDFTDDECRMLFIYNLPYTTNIQEEFMISRMSASKLYAERIRTRIIQAVGRCSRNPSDYCVVCILGNTIYKELTDTSNQKQFPPELRAEIQFGIENSTEYNKVEDILEQVTDFLNRTEIWQEAEKDIVVKRDIYWREENKGMVLVNKKLHEAAQVEVDFQYSMLKKNYKDAYNAAQNIISLLDAPALSGYKLFWNYIAGSLSYFLFIQGSNEYKNIGIEHLTTATKMQTNARWLSNLATTIFDNKLVLQQDTYFDDIIDRFESVLLSIKDVSKLEAKIKNILVDLSSYDGDKFERGHKELGWLLGYISEKSEKQGAPDPYWIINNSLCIVAEDKIYEEKGSTPIKTIPLKDATDAGRHITWIKENVKELMPDAEILTVFISNSESVASEAKIHCKNIFSLTNKQLFDWAVIATTEIRSAYNTFVGCGDAEWRNSLYHSFSERRITPKDYIDLIKSRKLSDL